MTSNSIDSGNLKIKALRRAIRRVVKAEIRNSWKGSFDLESRQDAIIELTKAKKALNTAIGKLS